MQQRPNLPSAAGFLGIFGIVLFFLPTLAAAAYHVKFIVGTESAGQPTDPDDLAVYNRLQVRGFPVTVSDDDTDNPGDASNYQLIVISATSFSNLVGTHYRDVTVPVLNWDVILNDDLALTGIDNNTQEATVTTGMIVTGGHYITSGMGTGSTVQLYNPGGSTCWSAYLPGSGQGLSELDPDLTTLVISQTAPNKALLTVGETGTQVYNGVVLQARRACIYLDDDFVYSSWSVLTATGVTLFDRTVDWLLGFDLLAPTPTSTPVTVSPSPTFTPGVWTTPTTTAVTSSPSPTFTPVTSVSVSPTFTNTALAMPSATPTFHPSTNASPMPASTRTPTPLAGSATVTPVTAATSAQVVPNPAWVGSRVFFQVDISEPANIEITLYNSAGERVAQSSAACPAGITRLPLETSQLATGIYFYHVRQNGQITSRNKLVLMR